MIRSAALVAFLLLLVPACLPVPTPPGPAGDAAAFDAGGSVCAVACQNLAELDCKEGLAPNCSSVCEKAQAGRITDLHPACLSIAHTKTEARACKSVSCP